jgi:hypothetical protein
MTSAQLARVCWLGFLVAGLPYVMACLLLDLLMALVMFGEGGGPLEHAAPPRVLAVALVLSLSGAPVFWALGFRFAHRFNRGWRALVPFGANLLPLAVMGGLILWMWRDEGGKFPWIAAYLGGLALLLLVGGAAAARAVRS